MEENTSEQTNIHEEIATEEAQAINAYIDKLYILRVPIPEKPKPSDLSFFNLVGLEAFGYTLSAFSGLMLSAIRTGGLFFLLEETFLKKNNSPENINWMIAFFAASAALGAFEVYLLIDGIKKGRKQKELKNSKLGIIVAATVVVTAGLFSSFALIDIAKDVQVWMNVFVGIVTGVGSASILFLGGENIGFTLEDFQTKKKKIIFDYQQEYLTWRESGVRSYKTSQFNFNRKGGSIYSKPVQPTVQSEQKTEQPVQEVFVVEKPLPIYEQIRIAIEKYVIENHVLPPVNKFSEENNFSKAYVSTSLNEYIFKNQKWLLEEGLVDFDRVQKAKNSVEKVKPGTTEVDEDDWPINKQ